ncbi:MAG: carbon storage regulator [Acidobacteria bacterium]|nr:carbon storage regulator [Acidobacteriota bacterium]
MLVIRRRPGESLYVGAEVRVEVLSVEGSQVKLGIEAPRAVTILRDEVRATQQANLAAARLVPRHRLDAVIGQFRR